MTLSRRRTIVFALAAVAIAGALASAALLAVDVYLHGRYQRSAGFNVWGYRGASVGKKKPGEFRVAVLGGSAAYGYGVTADEAIPAVLERLLRARTPSPLFTVVNLAYNNEGAYSFRTTLEDYRWLDCDLVFLYEGYNDLNDDYRVNVSVFRHDSPIFRLTGYLPIFPIIFREKASIEGKTVFASVLQTTADVASSLEAQLGRVNAEPARAVGDHGHTGCAAPWGPYCQSVGVAIELARAEQRQVLVGGQPYLRVSPHVHAKHVAQQKALGDFVSRRFGSDAGVRYIDFGDLVDLENPHMSFDHMHLRTAGNARVAAALVDTVIDMAGRRQKTS